MTSSVIATPPQNNRIAIALKLDHKISPNISLEEFLQQPPEDSEWVDGQIIEKTGMGFLHSRTQAELGALLLEFVKANQLGGIVCTELLCLTQKQSRKPDVAYMSANQVELYGKTDFTVLPECFPLVIEIVSPTDAAEDVFSKAEEYLKAGAEEVWLIFPKNRLIVIATLEISGTVLEVKWSFFANKEQAYSPKVLLGFSVTIDELLPIS